MPAHRTSEGLAITTTQDRVPLARTAHRAVIRNFFVIFCILAAVILAIGVPLSFTGRTSLPGIVVVAVAFLAVPVLVRASIRRMERKAERFLAADGATQFVVGERALRIADTEIPYERITCVFAYPEGEQYSSGGLRGEVMAARMDLTADRPTAGRAVGARIGTAQRRRLYRDGAKSAIQMMIGVDGKAAIAAPEGFINPLRTLPHRGEDPGRIDVPFGAYLAVDDLETLLSELVRASGGAFPVGVVSGALDWATATTSAAETREGIRAEATKLFSS